MNGCGHLWKHKGDCFTCSKCGAYWCIMKGCGKTFASGRGYSGHVNAHRGPLQRRKAERLVEEGHHITISQLGGYKHDDDCPACIAENPEALQDLAAEVAGWIQ